MTNQDRDVRIAERIGYTFYLAYQVDNTTPDRNICWSPGNSRLDETDSVYKYEWLEIDDINYDISFGSNNPLHPFISASTPDTEHEVLKWVQGQDTDFHSEFTYALLAIVAETHGKQINIYYLHHVLRHYKLGDYAKALEAILEEADG